MTGVVVILRCYNVIVNIMEINTYFWLFLRGRSKLSAFVKIDCHMITDQHYRLSQTDLLKTYMYTRRRCICSKRVPQTFQTF